MRSSLITAGFLVVSLLAHGTALAFETDQYNLPPTPLADIGDEVTEYVAAALTGTVAAVNAEIEERERCVSEPARKKCSTPEKERYRLEYLRSEQAVAKALAEKLAGDRLMTTRFGKWIGSHKFRGQPDRYKPRYRDSIYLLNPANYLTMTPTVRLYGHEFGIDKLEHLLQQGWQYYEIYLKATAKGARPEEATQKAVDWGKNTERTYYGLLTSGVYSNADLAANYVGLRFYQGLTQKLLIGGQERPAVLRLADGIWQFTHPRTRDRLLRPFLSDHLNEAWNPSGFRFTLFGSVRRSVKNNACPEWVSAHQGRGRAEIAARTAALAAWNDEDYGFTKQDRVVSLAETCFDRD